MRYQLATTCLSKNLLLNEQNEIEYLFEFIDAYALTRKFNTNLAKSRIINAKAFDEIAIESFEDNFIVKTKFNNLYTNGIGELENLEEDFRFKIGNSNPIYNPSLKLLRSKPNKIFKNVSLLAIII